MKLGKLGRVNSEARRKQKISYNVGNKLPGTCNDPEGEDPKNAK